MRSCEQSSIEHLLPGIDARSGAPEYLGDLSRSPRMRLGFAHAGSARYGDHLSSEVPSPRSRELTKSVFVCYQANSSAPAWVNLTYVPLRRKAPWGGRQRVKASKETFALALGCQPGAWDD